MTLRSITLARACWAVGLVPVLGLLTACGGDDAPQVIAASGGAAGASSELPETVPDFDADDFSDPTRIGHAYFPLSIGGTRVYFGETEDGTETTVVEVLDRTREVFGVTARVVRDRVFTDGLLLEDTHDWFAEDDHGNVWYLGEEVDNYAYADDESFVIDHEGAWEAGRDVADIGVTALPGYQMPAMPQPGLSYHQEYYPGEAEDMAEVRELDVSVSLSDGFEAKTLETSETNPLEDGANESKFYAEGVGVILEESEDERTELVGVFQQGEAHVPDFDAASFTTPTRIDNRFLPLAPGSVAHYESNSEDGMESIVIEVLEETREVAGIECVVVWDRVFVDDVLVEDTHDWYAQDDDGNVWYMGEEVVNYSYEDGDLIQTDDEGSWEAGKDVADAGVTASPGIAMLEAPRARESYYQEWYPGEAEDMGFVVAEDVRVELPDGSEFSGCLQTLDWAPLEPDALEYKFYAAGVGLVLERSVDGDEVAALIPE